MTKLDPPNMAISATVLDARFQSLPLCRLSQRDQPLGFRILQRPQQDGLDDPEDRGGGANPESEGEDGGEGEGAPAEQGAGGDFEVQVQCVHGGAGQCNRIAAKPRDFRRYSTDAEPLVPSLRPLLGRMPSAVNSAAGTISRQACYGKHQKVVCSHSGNTGQIIGS